MRFETFKIGESALHSVSSIEISKTARNRVVSVNLNGDLLIDQGSQKRTIDVNIVLCSAADMAIIEAAVNAGFAQISFYEGATLKTITATCAIAAKPTPLYVNGDRASGVYYNNVRLRWEER